MSKNPPGADAYEHLKDGMHRYRTKSLFIEHKLAKYPAPFTLKKHDVGEAISMYTKYMEIGDPTEYQQAMTLLGSWDHWRVLSGTSWFKVRYLNTWRKELKVKIESERYAEMESAARSNGNGALQATKWIADRYTDSNPAKKRGRPSKDEKEAALRESVEEKELLKEESERLKL